MPTVIQLGGITSAIMNGQGAYILLDNTGNPITGSSGVLVTQISNMSTSNFATISWTNTNNTYLFSNISATGGDGTGASFNVTVLTENAQGVYQVNINDPGLNYVIGNSLTIPGINLGGDMGNDITITVDNIDENGGITEFSFNGMSLWPQSTDGSTTIGPRVTEYLQVTSGTQPGAVYFAVSLADESLVYVTPVNVIAT